MTMMPLCGMMGQRLGGPKPSPPILYFDDANVETLALVNAWTDAGTAAPSVDRRYVIDHFITRLKAAGAWNGVLAVPLCHASGAARTNWISPGAGDFEKLGTVTFAADTGEQLDGSTGYLRGTLGLSATPGLAQDDAAAFIEIQSATSTGLAMGAESGTRLLAINPRTAGGLLAARVNNASTVNIGAVPTRNGLSVVARTDAANITGYKDGTAVATVAAASTAPSGQTGAPTFGRDSSTYSDGTLRLIGLGRASGRDEAAFAAAWAEYRDNILVDADAPNPAFLYSLMPTTGIYVPAVSFFGRPVSASCGGTSNLGMTHAIRSSVSGDLFEFGIRNTPQDQLSGDHTSVRRSEINEGIDLDCGVQYTYAYTAQMLGWAVQTDPLLGTVGVGPTGLIGQMHVPDFVEGSPAWGLRVRNDGQAWITSRDPNTQTNLGSTIWTGTVDWEAGVDVVVRVTFGLTAGYLEVWVDGVKVVDQAVVNAISDSGPNAGYFKIGGYFSSGLNGLDDLTVRLANYLGPETGRDISARIATPLSMPGPYI